MEIHMSKLAYCKMILHLAKYPYSSCNGLLLSKKQTSADSNQIQLVDCLPLFHSSTTLNPALEIALLQIDSYCQQNGLEISGYYHANQNVHDKKPNLICAKIAEKLKDNCNHAFVFLVDNHRVHPLNKQPCYEIFQFVDHRLTAEKCKQSLDEDSYATLLELLKKELYKDVADFDNHLDDITIDWRNNKINKSILKAAN